MDYKKEDFKPKYLSEAYYDVFLKGGTLEGWKTSYLGMGRVTLTKGVDGHFSANHGLDNNWMEKCWNDFIDFVWGDEQEEAPEIFPGTKAALDGLTVRKEG